MIRNTIKVLFIVTSICALIGTHSLVFAAENNEEIVTIENFDILAVRSGKPDPIIALDERELIFLDQKIETEAEEEAARLRELELEKERIAERASKIREYLASRNAPLADYAEHIVKAGEEHGVEPELIAAISVIESGGGKITFLPYNAWGWGRQSWPNWETAINEYAAGLAKGYISKGIDTPAEIAPIYCPPNQSSWRNKVNSVLYELKA